MKRPKLNPWAAAALAAACVPFSVLPMADTGFSPELWHLTPLFAVGLLFGCGLATWRAVMAVAGVRLAADLGIWAVTGKAEWAFYGASQLFVYAGLMAAPLIGRLIGRPRAASVLAAAIAGPVAFFLVSNFGVWMGDPLRTLGQVYVDGLPFLRNSLVGTAAWSAALFNPVVLPALCGKTAGERTAGA